MQRLLNLNIDQNDVSQRHSLSEMLIWAVAVTAVTLGLPLSKAQAGKTPTRDGRALSYEKFLEITSANATAVELHLDTQNTTARNATAP
jgi:hypothetical protein